MRLGFQGFSQLVRDYGDREARVVMNTVGNIFSGQMVGETAKTLSERFGEVLQERQSILINRQDMSTSINVQMDASVPPSRISGLTQGMFVGSVSDNFNGCTEQKIFHCEVVVDTEKVRREENAYKKIPTITDFTGEDGNGHMKKMVQANYRRIKEEMKQIVQDELERIAGDDNPKHLLQQKQVEKRRKTYRKLFFIFLELRHYSYLLRFRFPKFFVMEFSLRLLDKYCRSHYQILYKQYCHVAFL